MHIFLQPDLESLRKEYESSILTLILSHNFGSFPFSRFSILFRFLTQNSQLLRTETLLSFSTVT